MPEAMSEPANRARLAINREGITGAKAEIADLHRQFPEDSGVAAFLALARMWTGDFEGAQEQIDQSAKSASILGIAAELNTILANKDTARSLLDQATKLDPDNYFALRSAFALASMEKDCTNARRIIARWLAAYPEDPNIYDNEITLLQIESRIDELQEFLEGSPSWFKTSGHYLAGLGRLAFSRHNFPEMETWYQQAVAMMPSNGNSWGYLAMSQVHQGKLVEAERSALFAVDLNPKNPIALRVLAKVASHHGDTAKAAEFQSRAAAAIPALRPGAKVTNSLGGLQRGDTKGTRRALEEQVRTDGPVGAETARRIILGLLIQEGKWCEARDKLNEIRGIGDNHPLTRIYELQILRHEGQHSEAVAGMREMLQAAEPLPEVFPAALSMFIRADLVTDTEQVVARLISNPLGNPSALASCVVILDKAGRKEDARRLHAEAIRRYPEVAALKVQDAVFSAEDGDLDRAVRIMREVPNNMRPKIGIGHLAKALFKRTFGRPKRD